MFRKIPMDELKKGMKLCALEKDDTGRPSFFMNSLLVRSDADIETFRGRGYGIAYVIPDDCAAGPAGEPDPQDAAHPVLDAGAALPEAVEFEEEIYRAASLKDEAIAHVMGFLTDIRAGRSIDAEAFGLIVVRMIDSIFRNPEALTCLAWLRDNDDCTFRHSLNSCILSIALGSELGFNREKLIELGMAAVLHDIGKLLVPGALLKKTGRYTESELAQMQRHSELGADLLHKTDGIKRSSIITARQHHERMDGKGYPEGLSGTRIHEFGRIVSVAEGYEAMTSERAYRKSFTPHEALQVMSFGNNSVYDARFLQGFIRCVGIYPIGSVVELSTGEIAVVKSNDREDPLKPAVLVVLNRNGQSLAPPVELALSECKGLCIKGSASPGKYGIDTNRFILGEHGRPLA
ncbi:MAG: HD-GYP domain-containing protein [Deltaproteobacteria bacterium]|nr:HD-GYP domain-containing protein [Deltaproteobacteria bacterium]MBZ0218994.1 HD-GYP domain-containing protein [Deltaproteobacteria bacterium]